MQKFKQFAMLCALAAVCGNAANADRLWLIGEALPYGWDTDKATLCCRSPMTTRFSPVRFFSRVDRISSL